jgi:hypothetical protein
MTYITKQVNGFYSSEEILPTIKQKWPANELDSTVNTQQDNAKTGLSTSINNEEWQLQ